jgi:hypothetical protein
VSEGDDNAPCDFNDGGQDGAWCYGSWQPTSGVPDESNWMGQLSDGTRLSQVTLGGTHDTGTFGLPVGGYPYAQTQTMDIANQLQMGVRALDLRPQNTCQPSQDCALEIYHGPYATGIYLDAPGVAEWQNVMQTVTGFLSQHRYETVVMNIQDESDTTPGFAQQVKNVLSEPQYSPYVWSEAAQPQWGDDPPLWAIRGKIVVISQGAADYSNPPSTIVWPETQSAGGTCLSSNPCPPSPPNVQDYSSCPPTKQQSIDQMLGYSSAASMWDLNLNFTSSECDSAALTPYWISEHECTGAGRQALAKYGCNYWTLAALSNSAPSIGSTSCNLNPSGPKRYGLIFSDFPGPCLDETEIAQNPTATKADVWINAQAPQSLAPGVQSTYTVTVSNNDFETTPGDETATAQNVTISNPSVPSGSTVDSETWTYSPQGAVAPGGPNSGNTAICTPAPGSNSCTLTQCPTTNGSCSLNNLPEDGTVTETYTITPPPGWSGSFYSGVNVTTSTNDSLNSQWAYVNGNGLWEVDAHAG